ncbi:MAG: hypothetical protein FWG72_10620 [Oscillospiraceae bacterium]|nr:hypothetical protein [Oscillospiraceae bacterium]
MIKSMFFNSTAPEDGGYAASDFAGYFNAIISDGVFTRGRRLGLTVTAMPETMQVTIAPGAIFVKGHMCMITDGEAFLLDYTPVHPRTDFIVMRLDFTRDATGNERAGSIYPAVVKGEPGGEPPELRRETDIWEMLLCEVSIPANAMTLDGAELTDRRPDDAVCGFAKFLGDFDEVDGGSFIEDWEVAAHNINAATHKNIIVSGGEAGVVAGEITDTSADLDAHKINPLAHQNLIVDGDRSREED